jgi:arsenite-transporting ATPase
VTSTKRASRQNPTDYLSSFRYHFFGGKGGVGKTTAASATALFLLDHAGKNESILLFSTDPAHSLSDSLETKIGNRLIEVQRHRTAKLFAYEMDATLALERFRTAHGEVLAEIAERGTLLDESDIKELLNLSLPGLDEVMSLFELSELDRAGKYSHIVVDTAPSGHTSRLLRLPEVFASMVVALDRMADKHRYMVAQFARRRAPADEVDLFLQDLTERIQRVRRLITEEKQTNFSLVAIPEAMSVSETERYFELLRDEGVPVRDLIVNRVETEHDGCKYCRARVSSQRPRLKELTNKFKDLRLHHVPLMAREVRGFEALRGVGSVIWTSKTRISSAIGRARSIAPLTGSSRTSAFSIGGRRLYIFGGKGGVGKTTAAAAFALSLAAKDRKKRVLIFSTDPAHSLSDSFAVKVGPLKKGVARNSNLDAMEIDPGRWFEELKERYRTWTDDLFASIAGSSRMQIQFDREAMRELVELTPPGIDEIAALSTVSDLLESGHYHSIILDTAPTGHLIRFLELPQVALSWIRTFIKLLLKYQNIVRANELAEELVALSKSIKRVLALLTDGELCEFVGVAIPERMSLEETADLTKALAKLNVPLQRILINGLVSEDAAKDCTFCASRLMGQKKVVAEFERHFGRTVELYVAPQQPGEIRGAAELVAHFKSWKPLVGRVAREAGLRTRRAAVKNVKRSKSTNGRNQSARRATR